MNDTDLFALVQRVAPAAVRLPPGLKAIAAAIEEHVRAQLPAEPAAPFAAIRPCCQDFEKCREMCCVRADYWQGQASQLRRGVVEETCSACKGSGEGTCRSWGHGPDDYEEPCACGDCGGSGVVEVPAAAAPSLEVPAAEPASDCGHPASLMPKSAETGLPLYCELCDDKGGRRDAEQRETELSAQLREAEETIRQLTRALGEEINSPTFMGEPVLAAQPSQGVGEPVGNASIVWTICRMALMGTPSEAMIHQVERLAAVSEGIAEQQLRVLVLRARQAESKPHVIAGPSLRLKWQGDAGINDVLAKVVAWGHATGGISTGPTWQAVLDALAAPTPPLAAAPEWQPIETAPTDGRTLLLGYFNSHGKWRTMRGQWMSEDYIGKFWEEPDNGEPGWFETSAEADDVPNCWAVEPTHWMPLPPQPKAEGAAPTPPTEGGATT